MNTIFENDKNSPHLEDYTRLLYDQALLLEGSKPKDPAAFAKVLARLMVENAEKY
ncbi:MAG: heat shock protein 90 [Deltaproteobacteria bacterium ADurb.Bin026]|nr:MAG: heat shock protein 90 [Deltaproteobacteria bacterium ADurb.Bin026]